MFWFLVICAICKSPNPVNSAWSPSQFHIMKLDPEIQWNIQNVKWKPTTAGYMNRKEQLVDRIQMFRRAALVIDRKTSWLHTVFSSQWYKAYSPCVKSCIFLDQSKVSSSILRLCKGVLGSGENGVKKYREQGAWGQKDQGAGSKGK